MARLAALAVFLPLLCFAGRQNAQDARPAVQHRDDNRIVLSRQRLDPPLRSGNRRVRFSPDGKFILLQDDSGIRVFSREPLEEKFYIPAARVLPAVFTADSQNVVISTTSLDVAIVSVNKNGKADLKPLSSSLKVCQAAVLSPMGNGVGCFDDTFKLHLLRLPDGQELVSSQLFNVPRGLFSLHRLPSGSAFSEPFGYVVTNSPGFVFDRNPSTGALVFSPDGRYLIAPGFAGELVAFDATNGRKFNLPGSLRHRRATTLHFSGTDQVAILDPQKPDDSVLMSFPDGKMLKTIGLSGQARDTSAAGYLVYTSADASDSGIFDLQAGKSVVKLSDPAADVYGRDIAAFTSDGNLVLSHLDNSLPQTVRATAGLLPMLQVAAVSPDMSSLALSTGGEGAVYHTADGKRISAFENIVGGCCDDSSCYLWVDNRASRDFELQTFSFSSREAGRTWSRARPDNKQGLSTAHIEYFPSAAVLFQHSMNAGPELFLPAFLASQASSLASLHMSGFSLRALDTRSGGELWKRGFESDPAVPFSDPQGDRFVLGWKAASPGGRRAMKDNPAAMEAFKHDKQANKDSYFEVLDPRTGKSLGGVLAQIDSPPEEFDSAFSEGDWLVLAKDGQRVFAFSLSSGQEVLKLFGWRPTLNAATSTLCLSTQMGRLTTYDLKTAGQLHNYNLAGAIVYAHFSDDGQKLLALTEDQMLYVLDVRRPGSPPKSN